MFYYTVNCIKKLVSQFFSNEANLNQMILDNIGYNRHSRGQ